MEEEEFSPQMTQMNADEKCGDREEDGEMPEKENSPQIDLD